MFHIFLPFDCMPTLPRETVLAKLCDQKITDSAIDAISIVCELLDPEYACLFNITLPNVFYTLSLRRDLPTLLSQIPQIITDLNGESVASSGLEFCEQGFECQVLIRCDGRKSYISVVENHISEPWLRIENLQVDRNELSREFHRVAEEFTRRVLVELADGLSIGIFADWMAACKVVL